jgi:F-type H+-transporting ATPase subunit a
MKRLLFAALVFAAVLPAQESAPAPHRPGPGDLLMPHLTDSKHFEYPCIRGWGEWACELELPKWNVHVGGRTIDVGPTKHTMWLLISAIVVAALLIGIANAHERHSKSIGRPIGFAAGFEAVIVYLRNEIYMPVLGHGGDVYVPFCLTLFFFILVCNGFGLIPYASTATGNLAVTGMLAIIVFVTTEVAGMIALGKGYINTVVYWPHDMPLALKLPLTVIMTPIELISKFTKPFALTVRLFANMIAGHVIVLSLIGIIFLFGAWVAIGAIPMALFISALEILVIVIQAFIFSLLAAVFIGQIRAAHH